jgi:hypothetical protein
MPVSILALFVIVIDRACSGSRTRADERAFSTADERACACTDSCADADTLRRLLFSGFGISMTSVLAAGDGNCDRERKHQQQN